MPQFGTDQEVLQTALTWLQQDHEIALVTVLKTWGSSPRPPGSLMVMRRDGIHAGSVSGGCVEEDLVQRYVDADLSETLPTRVDYGVNRQEATRFGLPCGGRLELLVEALDDITALEQILEALNQHQLLGRRVDLHSGKVTLQQAAAEHEFQYTGQFVYKVFGPRWHMLLIGAGHLSQYVSQIAMMLDYHVIVCDPRQQQADAWQVDGTELTTLMPDEAVQQYARHERCIVIALTHDPKLDDMALLDALASPAFYVGAIGSQRNCEQRLKRLQQMGLTETQRKRLHAPVGLAIGSHTPPEIAVSILAEITTLRNRAAEAQRRAISAA